VTEHVEEWKPGVTWEPSVPDAVLLSRDDGRAVLALNAQDDDPDQRSVVFVWTGVKAASMGGPNDEALAGHRLYERGLRDVLWVGVVRDSEFLDQLEKQNRVHPGHNPEQFAGLTHHVFPLKESTVEVVARQVRVNRIDGSTDQAAVSALG
jgi:hypothetical protein